MVVLACIPLILIFLWALYVAILLIKESVFELKIKSIDPVYPIGFIVLGCFIIILILYILVIGIIDLL